MENYNPLPIEEKWISFFKDGEVFKTKKNMLRYSFIVLFLLTFFTHCAKVDPITGEKVLVETDTRKNLENLLISKVVYSVRLEKVVLEQILNFQPLMFYGEQLLKV